MGLVKGVKTTLNKIQVTVKGVLLSNAKTGKKWQEMPNAKTAQITKEPRVMGSNAAQTAAMTDNSCSKMELVWIVNPSRGLQMIKRPVGQTSVLRCRNFWEMEHAKLALSIKGHKEMGNNVLQIHVNQDKSLIKMEHAVIVKIILWQVMMVRHV